MLNLEKFYELMKDKDISNLFQLSKETGIPYTTLSYMLSGHDMCVGTLIEISRFFNVSLDYMVNKSYSIAVYTQEGAKFLDTSSFIEAFVSTEM